MSTAIVIPCLLSAGSLRKNSERDLPRRFFQVLGTAEADTKGASLAACVDMRFASPRRRAGKLWTSYLGVTFVLHGATCSSIIADAHYQVSITLPFGESRCYTIEYTYVQSCSEYSYLFLRPSPAIRLSPAAGFHTILQYHTAAVAPCCLVLRICNLPG